MRGFKVAAVTIGLSTALTGTAVGLAGPAGAAPKSGCSQGTYPPAASAIALSRSRATVGMTISFNARCFKGGDKVTATVYSTPVQVGQYPANANGVVSGSFKVPALRPGRHTLRLVGTDGTQTSARFTVVPKSGAASAIPASSDPSSLAFTGSDLAKTGGLGALLLLGGGALVIAAKRRKHVNASV